MKSWVVNGLLLLILGWLWFSIVADLQLLDPAEPVALPADPFSARPASKPVTDSDSLFRLNPFRLPHDERPAEKPRPVPTTRTPEPVNLIFHGSILGADGQRTYFLTGSDGQEYVVRQGSRLPGQWLVLGPDGMGVRLRKPTGGFQTLFPPDLHPAIAPDP